MLAFAPEERPLIERVYVKHEATLRKFALRHLQDEEKVKEVIQDSAIKFMEIFHTLTYISEEKLYSYLYSIVRDRTLGAKRKSSPEVPLDALSEWDCVLDTEELVIGRLNAEALFRKIQSLPPRYGTYLIMAYLDKLPEEQIAKYMGVKPGSLRMVAHRAKKLLARLCGEESGVRG